MSSPRPRHGRASRVARGYTIVEVMMALAVLALGASGVIAMQKAVVLANNDARNLATATAIAQSWMERMHADALAWNEPGGQADIGDTQWIQTGLNRPVTDSDWSQPAAVAAGGPYPEGSYEADVMGADLFGASPMLPLFCTQVRLTRFATTKIAPLAPYYGMVRVEVRVYWERSGQSTACANLGPAMGFDAMATVDDAGGNVQRWGFVYLVSAAMENPAPY
jgi:prepilin-type N-terminal cleavage/methylation domain-containing protein